MIAISRRQILLSGVFLWLFAVAGTALVALTEYSSRDAIVENERQALLRNLYALLPADRLDNDIATDTRELPASSLLGNDRVSIAYRARLAGEPIAIVFNSVAPNGYNGKIHLLVAVFIDDVRAYDEIAFAELDALHAHRVAAHRPHVLHGETDAHPTRGSDQHVLAWRHDAGGQ